MGRRRSPPPIAAGRCSEIPPNGQGIAALMMLNLMEPYPLAEYGFHSPKALHVMIEAKKLAYADMLHYVGDPRFAKVPVPEMLDKTHAVARAKLIDAARRAAPRRRRTSSTITLGAGRRHDLSLRRRQGRQHRVADPEQLSAASDRASCRRTRASCCTTAAACSRCEPDAAEHARAAQAAAAHDHSRRSWRRMACGSASASWADGTRRRRTRSSSRTSPTTA